MNRAALLAAALITTASIGAATPALPAAAPVDLNARPGLQRALSGPEEGAAAKAAHRLIIGWTRTSSKASRTQVLASREWTLEANYPALGVSVVSGVASPSKAAASVSGNPAVRYAQPDGVSELMAPQDEPSFGSLWGLHNTGQTIQGQSGTVDADMDVLEAWTTSTGVPTTVVAVLDTGLDPFQTEFAGRIWTNPGEVAANGVDDDANGFIDDVNGWDFVNNDRDPSPHPGLHGTHVAGTIAASVNGVGVTGVAPSVTIMPLRVCDTLCPFSAQLGAINYARIMGADVANMSLGGSTSNNAVRDAIIAASNINFAIAAGNETNNNDAAGRFPCNYPADNIVCVAATDNRDQLASFSNFGATTVDVAAPGVDILSSIPATFAGDAFTENFDGAFTWTPSGGIAPSWGTTTSFPRSAPNALTDSPGIAYPNNQGSQVLSPLISLPASPLCVWQSQIAMSTEYGFDFLDAFVQVGATQTTLMHVSGPVNSYDSAALNITAFAGQNVQLGYRFTSDVSVTDVGAFIDDIVVRCGAGGVTPQFGFLDGTSMATPHVAGVLALMRSVCPACTVAEIKTALLNTVDPKANLTGIVATGGRVNANAAVAAVNAIVPPTPGIDAVVPGTLPPGSVASLQVQGSGFTGAQTIFIPGVEMVDADLVSDTLITAEVIVGDGAPPGFLPVTVAFSGSTFDCVDCLQIGAPVPVPICDGIGGRTAFVGTPGDDAGTGTTGGDVFCGFDGDDLFDGLGGDDLFDGLGGDDVLVGGFGTDNLRGGDGIDLVRGGPDVDNLYGGPGPDDVRGGSGDDVMSGAAGDDLMIGGSGNDSIKGVGGADDLRGASGHDLVRGGDGDDDLLGGNGNDGLFGDAGDDFIDAQSRGSDFVRGGSGINDVCDRDNSDDVAGCEVVF